MSADHERGSRPPDHQQDAALPRESAQGERALAPLSPPRPESAAPPFSRHALFGGAGEVKIWNLLPFPERSPPFRAALWCELEARGRVGAHRQEHYPELIICLAGAGEVHVGARKMPFHPGVCVYLPLGAVLQLNNLSDHPLSYWIIKAANTTEDPL